MTKRYARYDDTLEERLWARVDRTGECWVWTGATAPMGWYGHFQMKGKSYATHRVSWELANGPIPEGMQVLHRCDNPPCVRPDHLFLGTITDNVRDASRKGRLHPGEANGMARLTEAAVIEIRSRFTGERGQITALAREFGVTESAIRQAARRQTWRLVA